MINLLFRWFLGAAALMLVAYLVPGFEVTGIYAALISAVFLGLFNAFLKPVLVLLTLPINFLTLGLFTFVINAAILWFIASFVDGFEITSLWAALLGALVLAIINWLVSTILDAK